MRYKLKQHAKQRLRERHIEEQHLQQALSNIIMQRPAEPGSVCIVGIVKDGRQLAIYVSGGMPPVEPLAIRTVVWRD